MSEERRTPFRQPTEDRKLLRPAPYADTSFLDSDAWRALRIMGEFVDGFDALARLGPAVSIFGSARTPPDQPMYREAANLAAMFARHGITVITGGGPGIMEAANKGAAEAGGVSVGLGIELPHEQKLNEWCTLALNFRYFFVRKTMFVKYAQGFVIFPGGYGTFDELFESLTLVQTGKIEHFPIVLFGTEYWDPLVEWLRNPVAQAGMISSGDLDLFCLTNDPDEAVRFIEDAMEANARSRRQAEDHPAGEEPAEAQQEREAQTTAEPM